MYNQMPFGMPNNFNPGGYMPYIDNNQTINKLEDKINDLEKRIKVLEKKLNISNYDNPYQSSMYMM